MGRFHIAQRLPHAGHRTGRHVRLAQRLDQLVAAALPDDGAEPGDELVSRGDPLGVGRVAPFGVQPQHLQQPRELRVVADRDGHVPSRVANDWYGTMFGWALPHRRGSSPVASWLASTLVSAATLASIRLTSTAGGSMSPPRAFPSSAASAPTATSSPASRSSSATPAFCGGPSLAGYGHQPAHGLRQKVVGGQLAIAASEAADHRHRQARVGGTQPLGVQPQPRGA